MGHAYLRFVKKVDDFHRYFDSMTSSSVLCIATPKTFNFSNFHQVKLKFVLGVDFGTLISNFNSKIRLNVKI